MGKLHDRTAQGPRRREPPYRPIIALSEEERAELRKKLDGAPYNLDTLTLRLKKDPSKREYLKAITSSILSAEFAGLDAFGRFLVEWKTVGVPWELQLSLARQMWDETRHTQLNLQLLEAQGGRLGEYPDTLVGGPPPDGQQLPPTQPEDPVMGFSTINVGLEGFALSVFERTRELAEHVGDRLMEHCHDYNMADEYLHVANGDYWIERLTEHDPALERKARDQQKIFEEMFAVFRESEL